MISQINKKTLLARLNRKLKHDGLMIKTCRKNSRAYYELGRHYLQNERNLIRDRDIDLEEYAKQLDCMAEWEQLQISDS